MGNWRVDVVFGAPDHRGTFQVLRHKEKEQDFANFPLSLASNSSKSIFRDIFDSWVVDRCQHLENLVDKVFLRYGNRRFVYFFGGAAVVILQVWFVGGK